MTTDEKVKLAAELAACGKALLKIAEALNQRENPEENTQPVATKTPKAEKPLALEDVRAVLAEKSRDGYTADVRALLQKHGAGKLSEVSSAEYAVLLKEAEVLGNAG